MSRGRAVPLVVAVVTVAVLVHPVTTWVRYVVTGTSNKDRAELRAIEADPIVAFRAPGATLVRQVASVGSNGGIGNFGTPGHRSTVIQEFDAAGDARDAAAAYQVEAARTGWRLISARCSVPELTVYIGFWRTSRGLARTLSVAIRLNELAPQPVLLVVQEVVPGGDPHPEASAAADAACLAKVSLDAPGLQPRPPASGADLCVLVTLAGLRTAAPGAVWRTPEPLAGPPRCRLPFTFAGTSGSVEISYAAEQRRFVVGREARRSSLNMPGPAGDGRGWADTPIGQVTLVLSVPLTELQKASLVTQMWAVAALLQG